MSAWRLLLWKIHEYRNVVVHYIRYQFKKQNFHIYKVCIFVTYLINNYID